MYLNWYQLKSNVQKFYYYHYSLSILYFLLQSTHAHLKHLNASLIKAQQFFPQFGKENIYETQK